jgi:hypothetical protein
MATTGTTSIIFGAIGSVSNFTGSLVTGQASILTTSQVEAWLRIEATTSHSIDDLVVDPVYVTVGPITASIGFPIYATMPYGTAYGDYKIDWVWN